MKRDLDDRGLPVGSREIPVGSVTVIRIVREDGILQLVRHRVVKAKHVAV